MVTPSTPTDCCVCSVAGQLLDSGESTPSNTTDVCVQATEEETVVQQTILSQQLLLL
eukprot:CAMPEP_0175159840 /NCGR_PEP_ID=MMETSP0087-20121206/23653_1 /TAXON_ID=136419 /ORGANISM="Unknown Unknown, Strain D1" /LENGTH=56 /DNA_ID=CAMNT_0016447949 /DNA_START=205 /DNA_END=375 /DNA_ORIENTATION=-